MANILISFWAPILEEDKYGLFCFYESLAKVLIENGNNVLTMNLAHFKEYNKSKIENNLINQHVSNQIDKFSPDLIFTFNHQLLSSWRTDYDCPIVIWDADSIEMFSNVNDFKKNSYRYNIFTLCDSWINKYEKIGISNNQIFYISPATYLKSKNIKQDKNISIIASRFGMPYNTKKILQDGKYNDFLYNLFLNSLKDPFYDFQEKFNETNLSELQNLDKYNVWQFFDNRNIVLTSLLDLGLNIYGVNWEDIAEYNPQLLLAYNNENKYTVKHNEEIYNSSKICININHPQTEGKCFSWRVMDVMATNGCLVSSYSDELHDLTKDYVDIPMFHNHLEARKICKELLNNEDLRKEIVKGSNTYVKENANLEDRLKYMSEAIDLNLLNGKSKIGYLDSVKLIEIKKNKVTKTKKKIKFKTKINNKILSYSNQYKFYKNNYKSTKRNNIKLKSILKNKNLIIKEKNNKISFLEKQILSLKNKESELLKNETKILKNYIQLLNNEINSKNEEERLQNKISTIEKYLSINIEENLKKNERLLKYKSKSMEKD